MINDTVNSHAEVCPVCKGTGKYRQYGEGLTSYTYFETVCHGCHGKGWVIITEQNTTYMGGN